MNDFYASLKETKYLKILILLIVVFVSLSTFLLVKRLSWYELTPDLRSFLRHGGSGTFASAQIFLPSPVERYFLDQKEELWPDAFNSGNTLSPDQLPKLYTLAAKLRWDSMSPAEIEMARQRSVLYHTNHLDQFRETLVRADESTIRNEKECSPLMKDTMFRMADAWPELGNAVQDYFLKCDPQSLEVKWATLLKFARNGDADKVNEMAMELQQGVQTEQGEFSRWFLLEAYQWAHIVANMKADSGAAKSD